MGKWATMILFLTKLFMFSLDYTKDLKYTISSSPAGVCKTVQAKWIKKLQVHKNVSELTSLQFAK